MKRTWTTGRLQGATQLAAALCLAATPALAQEDSLGYPSEEEAAPADGTVDDGMGTDESEEAGIEDEPTAAEEPLGTLEPSESETAPPSPADTEPAEELAPAPEAETQGIESEGIETEGVEMEGTETQGSEGLEAEEPITGEQGAMLPGGLDEMGGEGLQASFEGEVRAIDLNDGTVELETEEQGTVSLRGESEQLQQLQPGQMVSVTYDDRSDGRWISEIQEPAATEPAAEESQENVDPNQAESVQQPQGKRMNEGYGGDAQLSDEEKAAKKAEKKAKRDAEQETSAAEEQAPEEKSAQDKALEDKALEDKALESESAAEPEPATEPALEEVPEEQAAEEGEQADKGAHEGHEGQKADKADKQAEEQAEEPEPETEPAEEVAPAEAAPQPQPRPEAQQPKRQPQAQQQTRPMPIMSQGEEPKAFKSSEDPSGLGQATDHAPAFLKSPSHEEVASQKLDAEGNRRIP